MHSDAQIGTPFQNQATRTGDKVAQIFDRLIHQSICFRFPLKFTYRFCWAGYVETIFRGKNLPKMMFFRILGRKTVFLTIFLPPDLKSNSRFEILVKFYVDMYIQLFILRSLEIRKFGQKRSKIRLKMAKISQK